MEDTMPVLKFNNHLSWEENSFQASAKEKNQNKNMISTAENPSHWQNWSHSVRDEAALKCGGIPCRSWEVCSTLCKYYCHRGWTFLSHKCPGKQKDWRRQKHICVGKRWPTCSQWLAESRTCHFIYVHISIRMCKLSTVFPGSPHRKWVQHLEVALTFSCFASSLSIRKVVYVLIFIYRLIQVSSYNET